MMTANNILALWVAGGIVGVILLGIIVAIVIGECRERSARRREDEADRARMTRLWNDMASTITTELIGGPADGMAIQVKQNLPRVAIRTMFHPSGDAVVYALWSDGRYRFEGWFHADEQYPADAHLADGGPDGGDDHTDYLNAE